MGWRHKISLKALESHASQFVKEVKKNPGIMINPGAGGTRNKTATDDTNKMVQSYKHGGRLLAAALGKTESNESLIQSRKLKTGSKNLVSVRMVSLFLLLCFNQFKVFR